MKIVCESCGAKYSIADEKVAGKVFKIRCKKCSAVIVVKGDQQSASAGAPQALDVGSEAVWHVVVGGDQQGPFAPRQIGELLAEGKIDWEAYVWREGMDGWQPAKVVPQLVSAVMAESESSDAAKPAASEPLFGGSSDMGADPFASTDDGGLSGVIGQAAAASASPAGGAADLFADSRGSAFGGASSDDDDDPRMGAPGPRVGTEDAMTGQRNENSVLFSLSNLQALATGSGAAPAAGSSKPGMAGGEGSGLIDIRALASATQTVGDRGAGAPRSKVDDLLAVGSTGTAFSATSLAAPVAVEKRDSSKTMLYLMSGAILLLGAAVTYLVARPTPQPTAQLTPATEPAATGAATPAPLPVPTQPIAAPQAAEPAPTPSQPSEDPGQPAVADDGRARADEDERDRGGRERRHRDRDRESKSDRESKTEKASSAQVAASETEKPEKKPTSSSGDKSLDDLLDTALSGKPKSGGGAPKPAENLPATPSREDVLSAMKSVTPKVQSCGQGQSGVAMAKVNVAGPTGKVASVDLSGQFAGTPAGTCISKEVAKAKFSRFSQSTFSFSYPFKL